MSLIYDYLKIIGQNGLKEGPDIEIPSTLKRRYADRFKTPSPLLLLSTCLIGALVIFLVTRIFITEKEMQVAVVTGPGSQARLQQQKSAPAAPEAGSGSKTETLGVLEEVGLQKIIVVPEKYKPEVVDATVRGKIVESPAIGQGVQPEEPALRETGKPLIVDATGRGKTGKSPAIEQGVQPERPALREADKPEVVDATGRGKIVKSPAIGQGAQRQKPRQIPVLRRTKRKIVFSRTVPVYPAPEKAVEKAPADLSEQAGEGAGAELSSPSGTGPAVVEKSGKFYQAGLQAQYKGDGRLAEIYYNRALEEMEHHMDAMINLSALYVQQGRYAEAKKILAEILAIEPKNSKALVNMGMVSLYQDKESQAEALFEAALAANPLEENALVNLAYLAEKKGDYLATEDFYKQLLQISPDNLEVLLAYGHLLEGQGRFSEAIARYAETLALDQVKKDRRLYNRIADRIRLLNGAEKNTQP